jgi:hypothetical protein
VEFEGRKYPVELKLRRDSRSEEKSYSQITGYMETLGCTEGWLLVFDRRPDVSWDDKIYFKQEVIEGKTVYVVGC